MEGAQGSHGLPVDAECAAIARLLETAALQPLAHEPITIRGGTQAAIRMIGSDEPGPGQRYALEARKHVATIRRYDRTPLVPCPQRGTRELKCR